MSKWRQPDKKKMMVKIIIITTMLGLIWASLNDSLSCLEWWEGAWVGGKNSMSGDIVLKERGVMFGGGI